MPKNVKLGSECEACPLKSLQSVKIDDSKAGDSLSLQLEMGEELEDTVKARVWAGDVAVW